MTDSRAYNPSEDSKHLQQSLQVTSASATSQYHQKNSNSLISNRSADASGEQRREPLLDYFASSQLRGEQGKLKAQIMTKYQMKPDSPLYKFDLLQLETVIATHPQDFPADLTQNMQSQLRKISDRGDLYINTLICGVGYSMFCRRATWFKLTGKSLYRWGWIALSLEGCWKSAKQYNDIAAREVFGNHYYFQKAVVKHNCDPNNFEFKLLNQ